MPGSRGGRRRRHDPDHPPANDKKSKRVKTSPDSSGRGLSSRFDMFTAKVCLNWFKEYTTGENPHTLDPSGMEKFCEDIGVEPENVVMLALAWKLGARQMGYFTENEWMMGMTSLQCDCVEKLQNRLEYLRTLLNDPVTFKEIYRFAFDFAKEENHKSLETSYAKEMLTLLLGPHWPLQNNFNKFLDQQMELNRYKVLNRDQWCNLLEFSRSIATDLSNYDEDGAWPVLLDEFVEWMREEQKKGPS